MTVVYWLGGFGGRGVSIVLGGVNGGECDGGECYCGVLYDPRNGTFSDLQINGPG